MWLKNWFESYDYKIISKGFQQANKRVLSRKELLTELITIEIPSMRNLYGFSNQKETVMSVMSMEYVGRPLCKLQWSLCSVSLHGRVDKT